MIDIPLYILLSEDSKSAAECFTFIMQNLGRATVIGEKANFGAHATELPRIINDYYIVALPVGEFLFPFTKNSWEGIGVDPDIECEAKNALVIAMKTIIDKRISQMYDDERQLNRMGYLYLNSGNIDLAVHIFKETVKMYPKSFNAYDSLGEAFLADDQKDLAIKNYEISLELNPENINARNVLKEIKKE